MLIPDDWFFLYCADYNQTLMDSGSSINNSSRQIAKAAGTVMVAFVLSSLLGLVRQILFSNAYGAGSELDAFNSANRVSETLFNLVAGGALSSAFIPVFTTLLSKGQNRQAWILASAMGNLLVLVLSVAGLIVTFFAPQVVRYALAPGFASNPLLFNVTVDLLRWMLPSAVIFALSGLVMSILNSHQVFFIPALSPAMYQLGLIIGVTILRPYGVYGLAWGVLIGSIGHLGLQLPSLIRLKGKYFFILGLNLPAVREVLFLMLPRLLGVAVVQLNFWVNVNLASRMIEGSVAALSFGFALMLMVQVAIAQSVATAALPTFSAQVAGGLFEEMRSSLSSILRWLLLLSIPASVGLVILSQPLVAALYQRGNFTPQDTLMVAWALVWYAVGLVGHSIVEILARAFYALHDTKTPVFVGIVAMSLNVLFSVLFAAGFSRLGWMPFGGLALANSLATALEMVALVLFMRRRLNGLQGRRIAIGFVQASIGAFLMAITLIGWVYWSGAYPAIIRLFAGVCLGGFVYLAILWMMKTSEIRSLVTVGSRYLAGFHNRRP